MSQKNLLVFGGADLQTSLIQNAQQQSHRVIVIDPDPNAVAREVANHFECVKGDDFVATCEVVEKYNVNGIITAATDKPLVMMAQIALKYNFPFYSVETAQCSTDKYLMKKLFLTNAIPCANGKLLRKIEDIGCFEYPAILKPRDNSGSRGVISCNNKEEAIQAFELVKVYTKKDTILMEETIRGKEYSVESLHFNGKSQVIQLTEKITTPLPYKVEIGHIQPAEISESHKAIIIELISKIGEAFGFQNCASHTELMINDKGVFIIETSPRLGGDFITSVLTPLSTGINMEAILIQIALGNKVVIPENEMKSSGIFYFNFDTNTPFDYKSFAERMKHLNYIDYKLKIVDGQVPDKLTNSLDRYGYIIIKENTRHELIKLKNKLELC